MTQIFQVVNLYSPSFSPFIAKHNLVTLLFLSTSVLKFSCCENWIMQSCINSIWGISISRDRLTLNYTNPRLRLAENQQNLTDYDIEDYWKCQQK